MRRPKQKFQIGDILDHRDGGQQFRVSLIMFDPSDGWEYGPTQDGKRIKRMYFEEDLVFVRREMTADEFRNLQPGDIVRHVDGEHGWLVANNHGSDVTAVRTIELSSPIEWMLIRKAQT